VEVLVVKARMIKLSPAARRQEELYTVIGS